MKTCILPIAILALSCVIPCGAQEQEQELVTLRFLSFPRSVDHEPLQLRLGKGEVIDVKARSNSISDPYQVPRLSKWSIGKLELNEEQEAVFTQYGSAPSIAAKEQLVLLIRKGKKNSDGLKVVLMDGGGDFFGGGEFFFMNAAKVDIAGILGEAPFSLEPGEFTVVKPKKLMERGGGNNVFTRFFFKNAAAEATEFFTSTWPANNKARSMVFFYHDNFTKSLRFHTIRDFIP